MIISWMQPIVNFIGLPDKAAEAFLFGFFRRNFGAAGLYDLQEAGLLSPRQLVVAAAILTLFVPCIAQFSMMLKERGVKTALAIKGVGNRHGVEVEAGEECFEDYSSLICKIAPGYYQA